MTKSKANPKTKTMTIATTKATTQVVARVSGKKGSSAYDWREATLAQMRALIFQVDPEMIEERKWKKPSNQMQGIPVWSHDGIVCTGETYKQVVKLTFAQGASLPDPKGLFNASLEGGTRRAIDIREGEKIDASAFKKLIQAAVAQNGSSESKVKSVRNEQAPKKTADAPFVKSAPVKLLSGGNPQIAKADGDAPVQAYIAAMPGWKSAVGKRLDAIIMKNAPSMHKAVRWNSPFYGIEGQGWILSFHVLTKYVQLNFFRGMSLKPIPPGGTPKSKESRWINLFENDEFDEAQLAAWVKQAAALPGWIP